MHAADAFSAKLGPAFAQHRQALGQVKTRFQALEQQITTLSQYFGERPPLEGGPEATELFQNITSLGKQVELALVKGVGQPGR